MKFAIVYCLLFQISGILCAQNNPESTELSWRNSSQLTMGDFSKESPGKTTKYRTGRNTYRQLEGYIFCGINFSYEATGDKVTYTVTAFMVPEQSWIRDKGNPETLLHEQAHFNITEIFARKLRKKLKEVEGTEAAKRLYKKCFADLKKMQEEFDEDHEGESGLIPKWKERIDDDLNKLVLFSNETVSPD